VVFTIQLLLFGADVATIVKPDNGALDWEVIGVVAASGAVATRQGFQVWQRFRRDPWALSGAVLIALTVVAAVAAPLAAALLNIGPNDIAPNGLDRATGLPVGPSGTHPFGVDQAGRDVMVRTFYGLRNSVFVASIATAFATVVGTAVGMTAGYFGGWIDNVLSRVIDTFLALPVILAAISIASVCSIGPGCVAGIVRPGVGMVTGIIAALTWPYIGRIVRGQTVVLRNQEFVAAARTIGLSPLRIMTRELLPNMTAPIIVYLTLTIPGNILLEASLSFFGIGIPQSTPSLGRMLADASEGSLFTYAWWMMLFPGVALLIATVGFNLAGDGLRDALIRRRTSVFHRTG
jgi:peptide/nickel transport system permease protein